MVLRDQQPAFRVPPVVFSAALLPALVKSARVPCCSSFLCRKFRLALTISDPNTVHWPDPAPAYRQRFGIVATAIRNGSSS